jgi:hypothetical protein
MTNNNYHKVLLYLKQFEGDGKFHEIESVLGDMNQKEKEEILVELAREDLIYLDGGRWTGLPLMAFVGGGQVDWLGGRDEHSTYEPFRGKLKFKGSKYLKEELEMTDKGKYNINVEGNSTANVIIGSPGATINNRPEIINKTKSIIKTIENDNSIDNTTKQQAIGDLNQFINEVEQGTPKKETVDKVLTLGSNIASIGSLVIGLIQLLAAH